MLVEENNCKMLLDQLIVYSFSVENSDKIMRNADDLSNGYGTVILVQVHVS